MTSPTKIAALKAFVTPIRESELERMKALQVKDGVRPKIQEKIERLSRPSVFEQDVTAADIEVAKRFLRSPDWQDLRDMNLDVSSDVPDGVCAAMNIIIAAELLANGHLSRNIAIGHPFVTKTKMKRCPTYPYDTRLEIGRQVSRGLEEVQSALGGRSLH